jgi:hypothetical protein
MKMCPTAIPLSLKFGSDCSRTVCLSYVTCTRLSKEASGMLGSEHVDMLYLDFYHSYATLLPALRALAPQVRWHRVRFWCCSCDRSAGEAVHRHA